MDLSQFMLALRARRKAFMLVLVATVATAIAIALLVPKRYVATATLMIDARDEQAMSPMRMSPRERAGYLQTQVELLTSGRVSAKVARDLRLAQKPGVREEFEAATGGKGSIDEWIGSQMAENVKIETSASNMVSLHYTAKDPKFAAEAANAFVKAYLETALTLRTEPSREAAEWFEDQMKGLRAQVSTAQGRLAAYQKEKGLYASDDRVDLESARLAEINTQLLAARNATYDAQSRHKQATELLAKGTPLEQIPEVLANGYVNTLKGDLTRAEARLEEQSAVLGPNHPAYLRTASEVQGLREKLTAEMRKVVDGLGNAALQSRRREEELTNALQAQHERILKLKDYRGELAVLTRDVDNAQRSYDAVLARFMTNKIDSRAKQTNVALLTPAIEPVKHKYPQVGLIGLLSLFVGGLLAAGAVFVLEMLDRRVRSRADLESRLAVPSLGRLSRWQPAGGGRLLPAPARAARALPHPW